MAQFSSQPQSTWSVGTSVASNGSVGSVPVQPAYSAPAPVPVPVAPPKDSLLKNVGADPFFNSAGPVSADEMHWAYVCAMAGIVTPSIPPDWLTRPVEAVAVESATVPTPAAPGAGASGSVATPGVAGASPTAEGIRHPDPNTSVEELRWQDHVTLAASGVASVLAAATANAASQPQQPTQASAFGLQVASAPAPSTPVFPTPVRTLFPPTPPAAGAFSAPGLFGGAALGAGLGGEDVMDCGEVPPDDPGAFRCMYATAEASMASPEEMRVVQIESYRLGRQIMPYWLVPPS
ncbi:hypothetical protein HYH02_015203 [Chlamydomonas schloesseri]|uniref:Uncharacterized protein n=1 Tax=Chlamydomonas schloesseri TaxID=2026947 RepID=A0A835SBM9_9CHLO|nr:hypothetical protein HYH02_015203 [Chlamydomonas schloesseri]|eukprot:KAG2424313.1 hypothetical protein HYH02_015203 [Chlamydomonas schloesseri]